MRQLSLYMITMAMYLPTKAQVTHTLLRGEWRLDSLTNKRISNAEKQKRYFFTQDTLYYFSQRINLRGSYVIDTAAKKLEWHIPERQQMIVQYIEVMSRDSIFLYELNKPMDKGLLIRTTEEGLRYYEEGLEAEKAKDFKLAYDLFQKAAKMNIADAMFKLGMCYFTGTGTAINEIKGSEWIRKSANLGYREAQAIVNSNSLRY